MSDIVGRTQAVPGAIALHEARTDLTAFLAEQQPETSIETLAERIASPDVKGLFANAILGADAVPHAVYDERSHR
ncbi:MAG: hypothetical protein AcusKO_34260 [Acuticoccus sp.]